MCEGNSKLAELAAILLEPTRSRMIPPGAHFMAPGPPTEEEIAREAVRQARMLMKEVQEVEKELASRLRNGD